MFEFTYCVVLRHFSRWFEWIKSIFFRVQHENIWDLLNFPIGSNIFTWIASAASWKPPKGIRIPNRWSVDSVVSAIEKRIWKASLSGQTLRIIPVWGSPTPTLAESPARTGPEAPRPHQLCRPGPKPTPGGQGRPAPPQRLTRTPAAAWLSLGVISFSSKS